MRRSLAPSQKHKLLENQKSESSISRNVAQSTSAAQDDMVTIQRLPLFGFLEIPKSLSQQFKIPSGCVLTEKSIALRKVKRLGPPKNFHIVRPGDYANALVKHTGFSPEDNEDGENEEEGLPTSISSLPPFEPLVLWSHPDDAENKVEVIPQLACKLRPHQREGVQFLFECTMGLRGFEGQGCILADDMGLGKTLMSITLLWTLLNQGLSSAPGASAVRKIVVVCPTSLVGNWDNEIRKWVGEHCPTFAVKTEPKKMIKTFLMHRGKGVLIVSYETQRLYSKLFEAAAKPSILSKSVPIPSNGEGGVAVSGAADGAGQGQQGPAAASSYLSRHSNNNVCDLLICDEAHKLKNADSGLAKSLNMLPARKRILLSGTPMQNELTEFFNMVNFCNPNVLGTNSEFKKRYERPILLSREPDASEKQVAQAAALQKELSTVVNEFILKRGNILNAQHLPPKLVQFVCCRLTPLQESLYTHLLNSKEIKHAREGKQLDTLGAIRQLINICSHPKLLLDTYHAKKACNEPVSDELVALVDIIRQYEATNGGSGAGSTSSSALVGKGTGAGTGLTRMSLLNPQRAAEMRTFSLKKGFGAPGGGAGKQQDRLDPELSGKMCVLSRMLQTLRLGPERIVIVSNYTQTLDLIQALCEQAAYPVLRLDGSISANKRTSVVDQFNNPHSGAFVFLLSSKAGGCGINLIGGSRLVLFDPDWNPASDKQAAARIWREGQKRRCFIYRFMSTGSIEEKIIQRQLSKEGLADIVDDKEQVNQFSSDELRDLFSLRLDTASDTHDTLRCKRCSSVRVREASKRGGKGPAFTPPQCAACVQFVDDFTHHLRKEAYLHMTRPGSESTAASRSAEDVALPFQEDITALQEGLKSGTYASLPVFGKALRDTMQGIEAVLVRSKSFVQAKRPTANPEDAAAEMSAEELAEAAIFEAYAQLFPQSFSVFVQFLSRWVEAVPELTLLGRAGAGSTSSSARAASAGAEADADGDPEALESEFVEQEGCPEDTDFNRWSHHTGVGTCEDEVLQHSLGDDSGAVSFVFGLEVNWSLLESREAQYREENELRKEQQRLDLEALNEQRRLKREGLLNPAEAAAASRKKKSKRQDGDGDADLNSDSDDAEEPNPDQGSDGKSSSVKKKRKSDQPGNEPCAKKARVPAADKKRKSSDGPPKSSIEDVGDEGGDGGLSAKKTKKETIAVESAAKPAAAPPSSRRAAAGPSIDPLAEVDHTFQADWEFLRRAHEKGKIASFLDFQAVLKQLKVFNNNWRVLPADYTNPATPTLYTRIPGMKAEACASYRAGFDYFAGEAALSRFMYAQAGLLGDAALVRDAVQALDQQPPMPHGAPSAVTVERAVEHSRASQKPTPVAVRPSKTLAAADIDFGDSDSDEAEDTRVRHKAPAALPLMSPVPTREAKRPVRRVIADSDDDTGGEEEDGRQKVDGAKTASGATIAPLVPDAVFDLTSPTQRTQVAPPSVERLSQKAQAQIPRIPVPVPVTKPSTAAFRGQENRPPNSSATSTSSVGGGGGKIGVGATNAAVKSPSSGLSKGALDAHQAKRSSPLIRAPASVQEDSGGSSNGSSQPEDPTADWTCTFCTLVNSARHDPVECSLCGNRRSYNPRPKRAASQASH